MFPSLTMLLAQISKLMGSYIRSTHQSASYGVSSCSKADLSSLFVSLRDGELAGRADERGGALAGPRGRWPGHVGGGASGWTARVSYWCQPKCSLLLQVAWPTDAMCLPRAQAIPSFHPSISIIETSFPLVSITTRDARPWMPRACI